MILTAIAGHGETLAVLPTSKEKKKPTGGRLPRLPPKAYDECILRF